MSSERVLLFAWWYFTVKGANFPVFFCWVDTNSLGIRIGILKKCPDPQRQFRIIILEGLEGFFLQISLAAGWEGDSGLQCDRSAQREAGGHPERSSVRDHGLGEHRVQVRKSRETELDELVS